MGANFTGKNLIFLISQPRAGSTMLQKILGSHPEIYTVSEPWLLLHPFYLLKNQGYNAEYNAKWSREALKSFFELFPNKEQVYIETVANTYGKLYEKALLQTDKKFFLDKTPRYYNIIPELVSAFPEAKFIILLRNPLAVLCSIISTWIIPDQRRWFYLINYKRDLIDAPELLIKGVDLLQNKDRFVLIHYEKLLQNPEKELSILCDKLEINFVSNLLENDNNNFAQWKLGDKKNPYNSSQPNSKNIESWHKSLNSPQNWRLASDYLDFLGKDTIKYMGYDYESMRQYLDQYSSHYFLPLFATFSLEYLLNKPSNYLAAEYRHYRIKIANKLEKQGIWHSFAKLPEKIDTT